MKANFTRRIWQSIKFFISRLRGTRMVWGFVRGDGMYLPDTRVGNTVYIDTPKRLLIENNVYIGPFSVLDASYGLRIDEGCQIAGFASIFTHSSHVAIRLYGRMYSTVAEKKAYFGKSVEIGAYSFIAVHSTILPGTKLGRGTIVSAHSVVSGQYPDFAILAGQPAKIVGDSRNMDTCFLKEHPELQAFYSDWAGELPF